MIPFQIKNNKEGCIHLAKIEADSNGNINFERNTHRNVWKFG